ncbi:MAG: hypothetical protein K2P51_06710 [Rhabdochlamydiaceae bacterium]|nr:hypothetical protein [Rhabdochlamydiaceae bacterium]
MKSTLLNLTKTLGLASLLPLCSSYQLITDYGFIDKKHPVHFDGEYRNIWDAKFRTHGFKDSHVNYADAHAFAYYSHFLTPDNTLTWELGYSFLDFDWNKNPRFKQDDYHFANASIGWVSTSIKDWRWILSAAVSVDAQTLNFGQSGVYYGLMWGRYQLTPTIGMHVGMAGYVGVQNGYLLPIIGVDWRASKHWQINGIFPVLLSVVYLFNDNWSTSLEASSFGRPYRFPIRAHEGVGKWKNGIFEVYSKGVELDLNYKYGNALTASIGGGWNFGGWILIKDRHSNHGRYYKYDDAPYAQGRLMFTF